MGAWLLAASSRKGGLRDPESCSALSAQWGQEASSAPGLPHRAGPHTRVLRGEDPTILPVGRGGTRPGDALVPWRLMVKQPQGGPKTFRGDHHCQVQPRRDLNLLGSVTSLGPLEQNPNPKPGTKCPHLEGQLGFHQRFGPWLPQGPVSGIRALLISGVWTNGSSATLGRAEPPHTGEARPHLCPVWGQGTAFSRGSRWLTQPRGQSLGCVTSRGLAS